MGVVVATALIGAAGSLLPPPCAPAGVRFVCFTDRRDVGGWEPLPAPRLSDPRRAARHVKTTLQPRFPTADASIWVDASFELLVSPEDILADAAVTGCSVVGFVHPDRARIRDEAAAVVRAGLAPPVMVTRQVQSYRAEGFDTDLAPQQVLTTTGLLVRWHTPKVADFDRRWTAEIDRFTARDQLSIDYAAWRTGTMIGYLPGHYRSNRYARYDRARHWQRRVRA